MSSKLDRDALSSDLGAVEKLLARAIAIGDPVGALQYEHRKTELLSALASLSPGIGRKASAALFFSGKPVAGTTGIEASFAGLALKEFQDIVSTIYAGGDSGEVSHRGPLAHAAESQLLITALARGSFGFILDEVSNENEIFPSQLGHVLGAAVQSIATTAGADEQLFEIFLGATNSRTLRSLKEFFSNLDRHSATLRIIDDVQEVLLDHEAVHRGRLRTEYQDIDDQLITESGILSGFLPEHKKFELTLSGGRIIYGSVSERALRQYARLLSSGTFVLGSTQQVELNIKRLIPVTGNPREVFRLVQFL